jgi:SAM-dependent methyltransferase
MGKGIYDSDYFRRYQHYLNRDLGEVPLFAKIGEWVGEERPKKVLDLGCGLGYLISWLRGKFGISGWGVDSSKEAVKLSKKLYPGIKLAREDARKLSFKNGFFDAVLMVNLIEHLELTDQKRVLTEAARVLKPKGTLVLSTPDRKSLYKKLMIHDSTHHRELDRGELLKLVGEKFKVEGLVYTNSIGRLGKGLNFFLSSLFPADILLKLRKI